MLTYVLGFFCFRGIVMSGLIYGLLSLYHHLHHYKAVGAKGGGGIASTHSLPRR
jgi:hypothetical protein